MIRLNRAGRRAAVRAAIMRLGASHIYKSFTKGEICRAMGIKSTSRMRDFLTEMVNDGELLSGLGEFEHFSHNLKLYWIPVYKQTPLPDHEITVNGVTCKMSEYQENKTHA